MTTSIKLHEKMSQTDEDLQDLKLDEEVKEEDDEEEIVYDSDTFVSGPYQSENCTIPEDILEFHFSFGYDCKRYFNLTVADADTLVFASGNLINFFDVNTKTISFRRSALGGGIGHIKTNPNPEYPHIAIAENGDKPLIIVYEWPSLEINCVLKEGSSKLYSHLDYSPDGELLVSQGGEPDYLITVWTWRKHTILLRLKSYVNDVYRVKFSPYVPGQLTTCGISHIKFWKMANTFTGLKMEGELGRFGKTEFSDILGVLPMPDEKVVSGCNWGNILVWDAGLIKLEVFRTLRRKCHEAPIVQLHYFEGELWTVSMDGHVRVWWYEKIDQADPPDDDRVIQIEPTYDFYTSGLMLMCLRKRYPEPSDYQYFGQDGNGGIWVIDLNTEDTPKPSMQIYRCHAGPVVDLAACPWGQYLVSFGKDGRLHLYDYLEKTLIYYYQFPGQGSCMVWFPHQVSKFCDELILGFDDGTLRACVLMIDKENKLSITQVIKPHTKPVAQISLNSTGKILVSGSVDATIFIFKVIHEEVVTLIPIGFIAVPNVVTCLTWRGVNEILVGCLHGEIVQAEVPSEPQNYTKVSYLLNITPRQKKFATYKAQIRRDIKIREIEARKAAKVDRKRLEMEKLKAENPGLDIDEEAFLADSDTEEELEPLYIPEVPNRIIWMQITDEDTIWLSMGGYDAGYIYEYKIDQAEQVPYRFKMIDDADDIEISSYTYNHDKRYLIFAMQHGEIRVNRVKNDFRDLSDYWSLAMHDNLNGFVPKMCFSYDEKYFFSCGHDGNVFSYIFRPEDDNYLPPSAIPIVEQRKTLPHSIQDEESYDKLSLEQTSLKIEEERIAKVAIANKNILREKLKKLKNKFFNVLMKNTNLLESQQYRMQDLEMDPRITEYLNEKLDNKLKLVKRKLMFEVEKSEVKLQKLKRFLVDPLDFFPITVKGLNKDIQVTMMRQKTIAPVHEGMLKEIEQKILDADIKGRPPERPQLPQKTVATKEMKEKRLEYFLLSLSPSIIETRLGPKLTRLLNTYRKRKEKWEKRQDEWEAFMEKKPAAGANHPEDENALAEAKVTIGDYKLKSAKDYKVLKEQRETTLKKYKQLLLTRMEQFNIRHVFNQKIFDLRARKVEVREELKQLGKNLEKVHEEIPKETRKDGPSIEDADLEFEFPERNLQIQVILQSGDENVEEEQVLILTPPDQDFLEKLVLPSTHVSNDPPKADARAVSEKDFDWLLAEARGENETVWDSEIRQRRLYKKLFEQQKIIYDMNKKIERFNNKVQKLANESYNVHVDAVFMDLYILTLHQELVVLKDFESVEDNLQETVNQRTTEVLDMYDLIRALTDNISDHNKAIEQLNDKGKHIQDSFTSTMQDNKFYDFLRKVFKKKYKPLKVQKDGDSSSESSSSSSSSSSDDAGDGGSIDSRDFGIIKQNLNECPKGCDQAIYNLTVSMRSERHQIELKIKEEVKTTEIVKKDLEIQNKKVKVAEKKLVASQEELETFQREKQQRLNQVRCAVVLKLDQFQHLDEENTASQIMDTLVFSKTHLSKLYKRVDQLQLETQQQTEKHLTNVKHLNRMTTDCKFMKTKIAQLKLEIANEMRIKFGRVIDVDEIEDAMLKKAFRKDELNDLEEVLMRKLVHNLRMSLVDIRGMYKDELLLWKKNVEITQEELKKALRENTDRQELFTLMNREKSELTKTLQRQSKRREHLELVEETANQTCKQEIEKWKKLITDQNQQIQELNDEIKTLKTKGMPPKPSRKEVAEEKMKEWEKFEEFVEQEEELGEEEEPFTKSIMIPTYLPEGSEDLVVTLIQEMLEALNVTLSKKSTDNFIRDTLNMLMHRVSVLQIVENMISNLPIAPDDSQRGILEITAEQLYTVHEPEVTDEDVAACAFEIVDELLDEVLLMTEGPNEVMAAFINKLVDHLPIDWLHQKPSIERIVEKLINSSLNMELDKKELMEMMQRQEAQIVLDKILETVYACGLDYLYVINN